MTTTPDTDPAEATSGAAMAPAYQPADVEQRLYAWWESRGLFKPSHPERSGPNAARPFTIIMPPPNLTGELHLGHALVVSLQDALTRWHRMLGDDTLWLPGVDHAAIAVNAIIERELAAEGTSRHDIGREAFLARTWAFVNRSRSRIMEQHRRLGASADWEREAFTMDAPRERAVRATFKRLYDDGLIYRAERLINWCVDCESAISDIEVEYEDEPGAFWHVRYAIADAAGQPTSHDIVIATTRPETIPADTAIAVNPEDDRYARLVGRSAIVPTNGRVIPIIADAAVSIEGGTGALKVTPGHDPVDFEIGERHGLPIVSIMSADGTLNAAAGRYAGIERFAARKQIVADLEAAGRLAKIEPYTHAVGHCQRSRTIVEPLISLQWWVDAKTLAGPAIEAVTSGRIKFVPPRFERTYAHWMEHIRDWCISRQIWWGHRIPVWYCDDAHITVAIDTPAACATCGAEGLRQDEDTLDTWFSSGLWPHSTLGWPERTDDLRRFYPTQVMETAYDIIFFWVARMIMLSLYNMRDDAPQDIPFDTVYLHGLVRASDGAKMSKSRGNVIDPLTSIDKYGTDGLRFALLSGTSPGNDQRITDDRMEAGRNLSNKLWNASRFVLTLVEAQEADPDTPKTGYSFVRSGGMRRYVDLAPSSTARARSRPRDLAIRALRHESGLPIAAIAERLHVSRRTVFRALAAGRHDRTERPVEDRWILSRLAHVTAEVDSLLRRFELAEALRQTRDFFWDEFADWYIELAKVRIRAGDRSPLPVLVTVVDAVLRLLHPFMPYVTEEIWQRLIAVRPDPEGAEALIVARYPRPEAFAAYIDDEAERQLVAVRDFVRGIRNIRAEKRVDAGRWVEAYIVAGDAEATARSMQAALEQLARARPLHIVGSAAETPSEGVVTSVLAVGQVSLPMAGLFDLDAERARLTKQIDEAAAEVARTETKLANPNFRDRAPAAVVATEDERLATARTRLDGLRASLVELG
ncbi:MAG: valine--tRNA ligase [Dehalococcoidia bacterium]|nr:valine--tRNA ligase [Dehalococcoidia bacterium]